MLKLSTFKRQVNGFADSDTIFLVSDGLSAHGATVAPELSEQ